MSCLTRIEGVTRRDRIPNEVIGERLKVQQDIVSSNQKRMTIYATLAMSAEWLTTDTKIVLNGYLQGQRSRGQSKKRWIDVVGTNCIDMGMITHSAAKKFTEPRQLEKIHGRVALACSGTVKALRQSVHLKYLNFSFCQTCFIRDDVATVHEHTHNSAWSQIDVIRLKHKFYKITPTPYLRT